MVRRNYQLKLDFEDYFLFCLIIIIIFILPALSVAREVKRLRGLLMLIKMEYASYRLPVFYCNKILWTGTSPVVQW